MQAAPSVARVSFVWPCGFSEPDIDLSTLCRFITTSFLRHVTPKAVTWPKRFA